MRRVKRLLTSGAPFWTDRSVSGNKWGGAAEMDISGRCSGKTDICHARLQTTETMMMLRHRPRDFEHLYDDRRLSLGFPDMERLADDAFISIQDAGENRMGRIDRMLIYLNRLVDLDGRKRLLIVGCGPKPLAVRMLLDKGHDVVGVEPVPSFVRCAREFVGSPESIVQGTAESLPVEAESQHVVFLDSVLEHVDSPQRSSNEMYRVLRPGGIAVVTTTNRLRFSLWGNNGEFHVRFFNWFPSLVKECYVFHHLHYNPYLANYTCRPAVHWFSYSELCELGRMAGFMRFYSILDLLSPKDPTIARSRLRSLLLNRLKLNPWLRALALTQIGHLTIMFKRPAA